MALKDELLRLLEERRGEWLSGEEMAGRLYVSRNAVWKAVGALRKEGVQIDAAPRRGYRLRDGEELFTPFAIFGKLDHQLAHHVGIRIVETTGSTNSDLKAIAEKGGKHGAILIAKEQTAARGRLGRSFHSPKDTGLYMSILLRPRFSAEDALLITACAAVAVSEAIDRFSEEKAAIKWVNDIYLSGKKVCGILTEAAVDFEGGGLSYAVCGIGVNLSAEKLPKELENVAGGILNEREEKGDPRAALAAEILNRFFDYFYRLPSLDFLPEYRRRSFLIGKRIAFLKNGTEYAGTAIGLDDRVRLLVKLDSGEFTALSSGEVTLKKGDWIK